LIETDVDFNVAGKRVIYFGVFLLLLSLALFVKKSIFVYNADTAYAIMESEPYSQDGIYDPTVRLGFTDKKGKHYYFHTSDISRREMENNAVRVIYDPDDPTDVIVDKTLGVWGLFINIGAVGIICLAGGTVMRKCFFF